MVLLVRLLVAYLLISGGLALWRHGPRGCLRQLPDLWHWPLPGRDERYSQLMLRRAGFAHGWSLLMAALLVGGHVAAWLWPGVGETAAFVPVWGQLLPLTLAATALIGLTSLAVALKARLLGPDQACAATLRHKD